MCVCVYICVCVCVYIYIYIYSTTFSLTDSVFTNVGIAYGTRVELSNLGLSFLPIWN